MAIQMLRAEVIFYQTHLSYKAWYLLTVSSTVAGLSVLYNFLPLLLFVRGMASIIAYATSTATVDSVIDQVISEYSYMEVGPSWLSALALEHFAALDCRPFILCELFHGAFYSIVV